MITPKHDAHISLIGTILIMWLMVGYVYFLTPLEPIVSKKQELQAGSEGMPAAAVQHLEMTDSVGGMSLTVELEKSRFQH